MQTKKIYLDSYFKNVKDLEFYFSVLPQKNNLTKIVFDLLAFYL